MFSIQLANSWELIIVMLMVFQFSTLTHRNGKPTRTHNRDIRGLALDVTTESKYNAEHKIDAAEHIQIANRLSSF